MGWFSKHVQPRSHQTRVSPDVARAARREWLAALAAAGITEEEWLTAGPAGGKGLRILLRQAGQPTLTAIAARYGLPPPKLTMIVRHGWYGAGPPGTPLPPPPPGPEASKDRARQQETVSAPLRTPWERRMTSASARRHAQRGAPAEKQEAEARGEETS